MKTFPTLYKKTNTGAIQVWSIVSNPGVENDQPGQLGIVNVQYGQNGTSKIQETNDVISVGKNVGKKNETTPFTQADSEALSKWESKLKEGYAQTLEDAQAGNVDAIIEGGVDPMLAQSFNKQGHKITFPCYVQPKLDGIRCIAIKTGDDVTLWSRSRKRITSCPHIVDEIKALFKDVSSIILDGELYNHELKNDFEKIISAVRTDEPTENSLLAQYHVYDTINEDGFHQRNSLVECHLDLEEDNKYLKYVLTYRVSNEEDLMGFFDIFKAKGYEGAIARNYDGKYENKRSNNLQKIKEFDDADFEVVGVSEGKGKLIGNVGAFVCQTAGGVQFEAKPKGNQDSWKPYLTNQDLWKGKKLVVKYQGFTNKNKVPRFPVGIRLKDPLEG